MENDDYYYKRKPQKSMLRYFFEAFFTKKYYSISGRAGRKEFWGVTFYACIFSLIIYYFSYKHNPEYAEKIIYLILAYMFIPSFALSVRRLHDLGRSAKEFLYPLYLLIVPVVLYALNFISIFIGYSNEISSFTKKASIFALLLIPLLYSRMDLAFYRRGDAIKNEYGEPED